MALIEADMIFEKAKTEIETEFLTSIEEAKLYPFLYTTDYLKFLAADAYTSNVELTIGERIPNAVLGKL